MKDERSVQWLAKKIAEFDSRIKNVETKPNLSYSSIDDGSLVVKDLNGTPSVVIGRQDDDTFVVAPINGPVPPTPSAPLLTSALGGLTVTWDGRFEDEDLFIPMDFMYVEVHASQQEGFSPSNETLIGTISSDAGGSFWASLEIGDWYTCLLVKSQAGRKSDPSEIVSGTVSPLVEEPEFAVELDRIDTQFEGVITDAGYLGERLDQAQQDLAASAIRLEANDAAVDLLKNVTLPQLQADLSAAEAILGPLPETVLAAQQTASTAVTSAAAAQLAAEQAQTAALEAASRATSYLPNGGFEQDLNGWTVDGATPAITTDAYNSAKAVRFTGNQAIFTEWFPVSATQWWETSGWYKTDAATGTVSGGVQVQYKKADNSVTTLTPVALAASNGVWKYISVRNEMPTGATFVRIRLATTGGLATNIDTVVLRNVTEVVGLEKAAADAKALATQAKSIADTATANLALLTAKVGTLETELNNNKAAVTAAQATLATLKDVTIPALNTEVTNAKSRLTTAESKVTANEAAISGTQTDLADAFGELGTVDSRIGSAKQGALQEASTTAQSLSDSAKQAAISAAAITAQQKADAALSTATTQAAADAKTKADAAQAAALAAAKTYADAEAAGAGADALAAAKTDATTKANAAETAAKNAAALDATAKANQAKADATAAAATDATSKANAAQAAAISAAATTAQQKADAAKQAAITAAASDAQTKADAVKVIADKAVADAAVAAQAASDAAGIANGKGKVLVQSTAPGVSDRNTNTLWIDTTGGANTPKRWTTGTTWVAVTDKAATDAAAVAATATTKANNAQTDATAAINAAAAAQTLAGTAKTTADNALTMAGSKSKVYYSTAAPSGTATAGDVWRKVDASKNVIGEWYWDTAWRASQITTEMISNLDVGKLTAGTGVIDTAVINKMSVAIATVIQLNASAITAGKITSGQIDTPNLAVTLATILQLNASAITAGTIDTARLNVTTLSAAIATIISLDASRITAGTINTDRLNANEIAAKVATVIQLNASRITAGTISTARLDTLAIAAATAAFQTVDVKNLFATTGTLNSAVITKLWADVVMSRKITADMIAVGSFDNMIVDPDFVDTDLTATRMGLSSASVTSLGTSGDNGRKYVIMPSATGSSSFKMVNDGTLRYSVVVPGAVYRIRYQAMSAGGAATIRPAITVMKTDGTTSYVAPDQSTFVPVTTTWATYDFTYTATSNASALFFDVQRGGGAGGALYVRAPSVTRMSAGELIVDGTITADHIKAGTITAAELAANAITAAKIAAGAIDGKTITGATLQTNAEPGVGVKILGQDDITQGLVAGIHAWGPTGSQTLSITAGRGVDYIGISGQPITGYSPADEFGNTEPIYGDLQDMANINDQGGITGQSLAITGDSNLEGPVLMNGEPYSGHGSGQYGPTINGKDLLGASFVAHTDNLEAASDSNAWMTPLPFGMVARGYRNMQGATVNRQEKGIMELGWEAIAGRAYKIVIAPASVYADPSTYMRLNIYRTTDGTKPTMGSGLIYSDAFRSGSGVVGANMNQIGGTYYYLAGTSSYVKILTTFSADGGSATFFDTTYGGSVRIWIEDMGLSAADTGSDRNDVRAYGAAAPTPPVSDPTPSPPPKKTYVSTFNYGWHKNYNSDGSQYSSSSLDSKAVFGRSPYYTTGGAKRSHIGFSGNIAAAIGSGDVTKVEVYIYTEHWHYNSGGTVAIGQHNNASAPGTSAVAGNNVVRWESTKQVMKKPEGRWITLTQDLSMWKAGTIKGITLRAPGNSTGSTYYGYVKPSACKLRITYKR